jgi:hypothetical protein
VSTTLLAKYISTELSKNKFRLYILFCPLTQFINKSYLILALFLRLSILAISFDLYFKEIIWGKNFFEKYLVELLPEIACSLISKGKCITKIIGNQEQEKLFSVWSKND